MTVYVESNFVLEIALGQEESAAAEELLARAGRGDVELALPSIAIGEPFSTVLGRSRRLKFLGKQIGEQVRDFSRSSPHRAEVDAIGAMPELLVAIEQRELERLQSTLERILLVAEVIPVDHQSFLHALAIGSQIGLQPLDALIYATVLRHLRGNTQSGPHHFVNKNTKDFNDPRITEELGAFGCEFVGGFDQGLLRIDQS